MTIHGQRDVDDSTPLTPEDLEGLVLGWVATWDELNQAETNNIENAVEWAYYGRRSPVSNVSDLLTVTFSDRLHRRMFGDVWAWAGTRRQRQTNIGVEPAQIVTQMKLALDDARYWHAQATFDPIEIAVRLHHRLVCVHPYPNGNGRQTRMMADMYLHTTNHPRLSWGGGEPLSSKSINRTAYIDALRAATNHDLGPLLAFAVA